MATREDQITGQGTRPMTLREFIDRDGEKIGVPKELRDYIFETESGFEHYDRNGQVKVGRKRDGTPTAARGVGQLVPGTAALHRVNISDPIDNAHGGLLEMKRLLDKYNSTVGDERKAMLLTAAGYNAGEHAVEKYHGIPPYEETQNYVRGLARRLKNYRPAAPPQEGQAPKPVSPQPAAPSGNATIGQGQDRAALRTQLGLPQPTYQGSAPRRFAVPSAGVPEVATSAAMQQDAQAQPIIAPGASMPNPTVPQNQPGARPLTEHEAARTDEFAPASQELLAEQARQREQPVAIDAVLDQAASVNASRREQERMARRAQAREMRRRVQAEQRRAREIADARRAEMPHQPTMAEVKYAEEVQAQQKQSELARRVNIEQGITPTNVKPSYTRSPQINPATHAPTLAEVRLREEQGASREDVRRALRSQIASERQDLQRRAATGSQRVQALAMARPLDDASIDRETDEILSAQEAEAATRARIAASLTPEDRAQVKTLTLQFSNRPFYRRAITLGLDRSADKIPHMATGIWRMIADATGSENIRKLADEGQKYGLVRQMAEDAAGQRLSTNEQRVAAGTDLIGQVIQLAVLSHVVGPEAALGGTSGLEALGKGGTYEQALGEAGKGALYGRFFKALPQFEPFKGADKSALQRLANLSTDIGLVGTGTYTMERATGKSHEEAIKSALTNSALSGFLRATEVIKTIKQGAGEASEALRPPPFGTGEMPEPGARVEVRTPDGIKVGNVPRVEEYPVVPEGVVPVVLEGGADVTAARVRDVKIVTEPKGRLTTGGEESGRTEQGSARGVGAVEQPAPAVSTPPRAQDTEGVAAQDRAVNTQGETPSEAQPDVSPAQPEVEAQALGRIEPKRIIRHSDPNIDGGEVIGEYPNGDLKVQNNIGGISRVQNPRRGGNREAAISTVREEGGQTDVRTGQEEKASAPIQREGGSTSQPYQRVGDVAGVERGGGGTPSLRPRSEFEEEAQAREVSPTAPEDVGQRSELQKSEKELKPPLHPVEDYAITQSNWDEIRRTAPYVSKSKPDTLVTTSPSTTRPGWMRLNFWNHQGIWEHLEVPDAAVEKTLKQQTYPRGQVIVSVKGGVGGSLPSESYAGFGFEPYATGAKGVKAFVGPKDQVDWLTDRLSSGGYKVEVRGVPEQTISQVTPLPTTTAPHLAQTDRPALISQLGGAQAQTRMGRVGKLSDADLERLVQEKIDRVAQRKPRARAVADPTRHSLLQYVARSGGIAPSKGVDLSTLKEVRHGAIPIVHSKGKNIEDLMRGAIEDGYLAGRAQTYTSATSYDPTAFTVDDFVQAIAEDAGAKGLHYSTQNDAYMNPEPLPENMSRVEREFLEQEYKFFNDPRTQEILAEIQQRGETDAGTTEELAIIAEGHGIEDSSRYAGSVIENAIHDPQAQKPDAAPRELHPPPPQGVFAEKSDEAREDVSFDFGESAPATSLEGIKEGDTYRRKADGTLFTVRKIGKNKVALAEQGSEGEPTFIVSHDELPLWFDKAEAAPEKARTKLEDLYKDSRAAKQPGLGFAQAEEGLFAEGGSRPIEASERGLPGQLSPREIAEYNESERKHKELERQLGGDNLAKLQGLAEASSPVARLAKSVLDRPQDFTPEALSDIIPAMQTLARLREQGESVADYLNQPMLVGERELTEAQERVLAEMDKSAEVHAPRTQASLEAKKPTPVKYKRPQERATTLGYGARPRSREQGKSLTEIAEERAETGTREVEDFVVSERAKGVLTRLGFPAAEKFTGKNLIGLFNLRSRDVRVNSLFDVFVVAHEGTHGISTEAGMVNAIVADNSKAGKALRAQITRLVKEFYLSAPYSLKLPERMEEGIAALVENYIYDPVAMQAKYPGLVHTFLNPKGDYYQPKFTQLIAEIEGLIGDYAAMRPEQRIGARLVAGDEVVRKDSGFSAAQRFVYEHYNELEPLVRYGRGGGVEETLDDPYTWTFTNRRATSVVRSWVKGKNLWVVDENGNWHPSAGSVRAYQRLVKNRQKAFNELLVARRIVEDHNRLTDLRNQIEALTTDPDADQDEVVRLSQEAEGLETVLENDNFSLQDAGAVVDKYAEEFQEPLRIFDSINQRLLDFAENTGLRSHEQVADWRSRAGYASFFKHVTDDLLPDLSKTLEIRGSRRSPSKARAFKQRKGSTQPIIYPTYNQIALIREIVHKGLENMLWRKVHGLTLDNPEVAQRFQMLENPTDEEKRHASVVKVWLDGTPTYFKAAPEFLDVVQNLHPQDLGRFARMLTVPSNVFTRLTTGANPLWALKNIIRDQITATENTRTGYLPVIDPFVSFVSILNEVARGRLGNFRKYMALGGAGQTYTAQLESAPSSSLNELAGERARLQQVRRVATAPIVLSLKALEFPANFSEYLTRYSEYRRALRQGKSDVEAMRLAAEVTIPFEVKGHWWGRLGQVWMRSLPYALAQFQVQYKYARSARLNPRRFGTVVAGLATAMFGTMVAAMLYSSDEQKRRLANLEPRQLSRAIYLPHPNGRDLVQIPVTEEIGSIAGTVNLFVIEHFMGVKARPRDIAQTASSILPQQLDVVPSEFTAASVGETVGKLAIAWTPAALRPTIETATNTRTYPDLLPIVPQSLERKRASEQYTEYTSKVARELGRLLDVSPLKVDYWTRSQFGPVAGMFIGQGAMNPLKAQESDYRLSGRVYNNFYRQRALLTEQHDKVKERDALYSEDEQKHITGAFTLYEKVGTMLSEIRRYSKGDRVSDEVKQNAFELLRRLDQQAYPLEDARTMELVDALQSNVNALYSKEKGNKPEKIDAAKVQSLADRRVQALSSPDGRVKPARSHSFTKSHLR